MPIIVITELAASERLLTASMTIAIELEVSPINALNATRKMFARIPIILVRIILRSRSSAVVVFGMINPPFLYTKIIPYRYSRVYYQNHFSVYKLCRFFILFRRLTAPEVSFREL